LRGIRTFEATRLLNDSGAEAVMPLSRRLN
jgi:hypothetical protein